MRLRKPACHGPADAQRHLQQREFSSLPADIPRIGRLPDAPDASATAHSKLCGSTVTVDLNMDGDRVTDFAHDVKACALGQASSSIMARHRRRRRTPRNCARVRDPMRRMLKENGPPPDGRWADLQCSSRSATTRRATPRPC